MTDYVNDFLEKTKKQYRNDFFSCLEIRPHVVLNNGGIISIQASQHHYCLPKDNDGPYIIVEIWNYDCNDQVLRLLLNEHLDENDDAPVSVPVNLLNEYIGLSGGINYDDTFRNSI